MNNDKVSFHKVRSIFFFGLIFSLAIIMFFVFRPFFYSIFWAAVLAAVFSPFYKWINKHLRVPSLSAFISLLLVIFTFFLPLTITGFLVFDSSKELYASISQKNLLQEIRGASAWVLETPLAPYLDDIQAKAVEIAKNISYFLGDNLLKITGASLNFIFLAFMTLYTLFFFFRDGKDLLKRVMHLSPLGDKYEDLLYQRFTSTARATLKGTLIVGCVQGILGGLLFWITGVNGALVWGVIMTFFSAIPAVGSFVVWLPAGILMLLFGNVWQGLVILGVGALVISTIDNLIRPPLVGNDIQMHPLIVLFSTLGGIFLFGPSGFVIGPIVAALFFSVLSIYDFYYRHELNKN